MTDAVLFPLSALLPEPVVSKLTVEEAAIVPSALALDSREVIPGAVFFALSGETSDGRQFISEAVNKGARVVIYDNHDGFVPAPETVQDVLAFAIPHLRHQLGMIAANFYHNSSHNLFVTGVTGTNGKTSVTHFIAEVLSQHQQPCAVLGTSGNGLLEQLTPAKLTTLDSIQLQRILADFYQQGIKNVAMEVSSHALDQSRIDGVEFNTAVYTQLSRDHLDYHHDMHAYAEAKALLFHQPGLETAVINTDDAFGLQLVGRHCSRLRVICYSLSGLHSDQHEFVMAKEVVAEAQGFRVQVVSSWGEGEFLCQMMGKFNVSNVLATMAVLLARDIPLQQVLQYVAKLRSIKGRMQVLGDESQPTVVVDYAHTPDALQKVLLSLREHCRGKLYCVFGCGGDRDKGKRALMGKVAEEFSDQMIITNDNPRSESPQTIVDEILEGISQQKCANIVLDRAKAIQSAVQTATNNDIVLIAGKGHETTQVIGDQSLPFDDVEHATSALTKC